MEYDISSRVWSPVANKTCTRMSCSGQSSSTTCNNNKCVSWGSLPSAPWKREGHSMEIVNNILYLIFGYSCDAGGLFVTGGFGCQDNNMFKYNFKTNTWTKMEPSGNVWPTARAYAASVVIGHRIFYQGGGFFGNTN